MLGLRDSRIRKSPSMVRLTKPSYSKLLLAITREMHRLVQSMKRSGSILIVACARDCIAARIVGNILVII